MSATAPTESELAGIRDRHLELLARGDRYGALREATALIEGGFPLADFVLGVLAPLQAEIGRRWQHGQMTPAEERVATELAESLLTFASARHRAEPSGLSLVVCVADNEHHNLPARMVAELLRAEGHAVTFLGVPRPRRGLGDMIRQLAPNAVVVSCSLAMNLPGVVALAGVAHQNELPVVVGGAGFAGDRERALKVGADEFAERVADVAALASAWDGSREFAPGPPAPRAMEWAELVQRRKRLAVEVAERLIWFSSPAIPRTRRTPKALADSVRDMLRFVEAAALVDEQILIDYARWHQERHTSLEASPQFTLTLLRAIRDLLDETAPTAATAADAAVFALEAGPSGPPVRA